MVEGFLKLPKWHSAPADDHLASGNPRNRFRSARFALFRVMVDEVLARKGHCRIIDIGGAPDYWRAFGPDMIADERIEISLVNISYADEERSTSPQETPSFRILTGNACSLTEIADQSFDIAHSNSVIEHVGRWPDMVAMANEARRVAPAHFIQTPYWGFPVEPHNRTPLFHWLPEQWRYQLVMSRSLGFWSKAPDVDTAMRMVQSNNLLDRKQFATLFASSAIYSEIVFGLTKSLIAVKREGVAPEPGSNTRRLRV